MKVPARKTLIAVVMLLAVVGAIGGGYTIAQAHHPSEDSLHSPDISVAPYKVVSKGETYYLSAYGVKSDKSLRAEIATAQIIELTDRYEKIQTEQFKILEFPAGWWQLFDRKTGKEIKP